MSQFPGQTKDGRYEPTDNYDDFLKELSKRTGAGVEQDDLATLRGKNPEDVAAHMRKLEAQYAERGQNVTSDREDAPSQSQATSSNQPTQAWNNSAVTDAINAQTSLLQQQMALTSERQRKADEQEAARIAQRDQLYGQLMTRAQQNVAADPNTPVVQGQVNAYRAEQDRAKRNYLSDVAESAGPYENLRGEQRIASERTGQAVGGFQAELLAREVAQRRAEVSDALNSMQGLLTAEQQGNLQRELSLLDNQLQGLSLSGQNTGLLAQTSLGYDDLGLRSALGFGGLNLQRELGLGGLNLQQRGQDLSMDQFLRELSQRQFEFDENNDFRYWQGV